MKQRIIGFDLARAYAIFGMFIVNFNFCFGSFQDKSTAGWFLNLFSGNPTAIFIICAGIGVSLMTVGATTPEQKKEARAIVLRRSWFLFFIGLLLYNWWPGDILHFYGGYMHVAALLLFVPRRYFLWGALAAIVAFHVLLLLIPIGTSWDFNTYRYADFWTVPGFLRNTFYNGWNALFPWLAYFLFGMWLGRLDWRQARTRKRLFIAGLLIFLAIEGLRRYALYKQFDRKVLDYIMYDYFPPYLPFMLITAATALMAISICVWLGQRYGGARPLQWLARAGTMTLTLYITHLTIGVLIFQAITGRKYTGYLQTGVPVPPLQILAYSAIFFALCVVFAVAWSRRFRKGPVELLMRALSDRGRRKPLSNPPKDPPAR